MRHFHAAHRVTGAEQWLLAEDGQLPGGIDLTIWLLTEVEQEPGEFDTFVDGTAQLDVLAIDAFLHNAIDVEAGEFRRRFITDIPGQESTYGRKKDQAVAMLAGDPGPFPLLEIEVGLTGKTLEAVATEIVARAAAWVEVDDKIESLRRSAKMAVTAAEGEEAKRAAAVVDWEQLLVPEAGAANPAAL